MQSVTAIRQGQKNYEIPKDQLQQQGNIANHLHIHPSQSPQQPIAAERSSADKGAEDSRTHQACDHYPQGVDQSRQHGSPVGKAGIKRQDCFSQIKSRWLPQPAPAEQQAPGGEVEQQVGEQKCHHHPNYQSHRPLNKPG